MSARIVLTMLLSWLALEADSSCTSNIKFGTSTHQDVHINSVNFTNCYDTKSMRGVDGCGIAKGKTSSIDVRFQLANGRRLSSLKVGITAYPNSLNGVGVPFPLGSKLSNPCTAPDKTKLICPMNKPQEYVYEFYVEISVTGVLAMVIPQGEKLTAKLTISGVDEDSGSHIELGDITGITLAVLDKDDEAVTGSVLKARGEPSCNDREALGELLVTDHSSRRVEFRRFETDQQNPDEALIYFHVTEDEARRSFGNPALSMSLNDQTVDVPTQFEYPCEQETADVKQTCQFNQLRELDEGRALREYKIRFNKNIDLLKDASGDSIITLRFKGVNRRAKGEISMKLDHYGLDKEVLATTPVIIHTNSKKKANNKSKRWAYSMEDYQEKITEVVNGSSAMRISIAVALLALFFN